MSDTRDEQDVAESLDGDVLPEYDDPEGNLQFPPDEPTGVDEYGITAGEERVDEPLADRVAREIPDPLDEVAEPDDDTMEAIEAEAIEPYSVVDESLLTEFDEPSVRPGGRSVFDDESLDERTRKVGRLIAPGGDDPVLDDVEADAVALEVADTPDYSAEEEAVHLVAEPSRYDDE